MTVGDATVEVQSTVDGETYSSDPLYVGLTLSAELQPRFDNVQSMPSSLMFSTLRDTQPATIVVASSTMINKVRLRTIPRVLVPAEIRDSRPPE